MELTTEIDYPGATVDAVMQMLLSEEFRNEVCVATGALSHRVELVSHATDDTMRGEQLAEFLKL